MSLVIHRKPLLQNYDPVEIPVEFLVIHYTGTGLSKTLDIFQDPRAKASSHLLVDQDGSVYELVSCLEGKCFKAWHAGDSYFQEEGREWKRFNEFSVGVELVNKNGNLFKYTKKQYSALKSLLDQLKTHYPALKNPNRLVGHEHIAGYRGKVDPGHCFDWPLLFKMNYPGLPAPLKKPVLPENQRKIFFNHVMDLQGVVKQASAKWKDQDWIQLNTQMEFLMGNIYEEGQTAKKKARSAKNFS